MLVEAILILAALYFIPALCLALYISYRVAKPPWHQPNPGGATHTQKNLPPSWKGALSPSDLNLPYDHVSFHTIQNLTLRAWLIWATPNSVSRIAVVCVHGAGRDRRGLLRHAAFLSRASCDVLLFDCANHGLSDALPPWPVAPWPGRAITLGRREYHDVHAAVTYMRARGARTVVVLGTSQGASSAIIAAALIGGIDLLLLENAFISPRLLISGIVGVVMSRLPVPGYALLLRRVVEYLALWRTGNVPEKLQISAEHLVHKVQVPMFFVHGTADIIVHCSQSQQLFSKVSHDRKELWLVEGAPHTHCHFKEPQRFEEKVLAFMKKHLKEDFASNLSIG